MQLNEEEKNHITERVDDSTVKAIAIGGESPLQTCYSPDRTLGKFKGRFSDVTMAKNFKLQSELQQTLNNTDTMTNETITDTKVIKILILDKLSDQ